MGLCSKEANKNTFLKHRMARATEIHPPQMQYTFFFFFKVPNANGNKGLEDVRWFIGLASSVSGPSRWMFKTQFKTQPWESERNRKRASASLKKELRGPSGNLSGYRFPSEKKGHGRSLKASCECQLGLGLRLCAHGRGVFPIPTSGFKRLAVSNEKIFSTMKLTLLEELQRESPSSYSEGKKKLPSWSGIWGYFMQMSQTEVNKGKSACL